MRFRKKKFILLALCLIPFSALASPYEILRKVDRAASFSNNEAIRSVHMVKLNDGITTKTKNNGIDLVVKTGRVVELSSGTVVEGAEKSHVVFQELKSGAHRALIHISEPKDPLSYEFKILGAARLELNEEGSVDALDSHNNLIAVIKKPWAKDSNNRDVPTYFAIDGTTLKQVVEHSNGHFEYGITADPFWVPAWVALRACMAHPVCREVAKQGTKAAIKWAMDHLF